MYIRCAPPLEHRSVAPPKLHVLNKIAIVLCQFNYHFDLQFALFFETVEAVEAVEAVFRNGLSKRLLAPLFPHRRAPCCRLRSSDG